MECVADSYNIGYSFDTYCDKFFFHLLNYLKTLFQFLGLEFRRKLLKKRNNQTGTSFIEVRHFLYNLRVYFFIYFFYFSYLSSIHEKAMYCYGLDGKPALAWDLAFPGRLSST